MKLNHIDQNCLGHRTISERKAFIKLFAPILKGDYKASLRYLYSHSKFIQLSERDEQPAASLMGNGDNIIIIMKGLVSGYILSPMGHRCDIWLAEHKGVFIYKSANGNPTSINLEAIEPTILLLISQAQLESATQDFPLLHRLFTHLIFPNAIMGLDHHTLLNKLDSTGDKLNYFMKAYPGLFERIPKRIYNTYASGQLL